MIDFLIKSVEKKDWMAWKFTALVETLRKIDKQTLIKIWDHCFNDKQHRLVLEIPVLIFSLLL